MNQVNAKFIVCKTLLVCFFAPISKGNGQLARPFDNNIDSILQTTKFSPNALYILTKQSHPREDNDNNVVEKRSAGLHNPFLMDTPNLLPISYFGKRDQGGDVEPINLENGDTEYGHFPSIASLIGRDSNEYQSLIKAIQRLKSEKGDELASIIRQYDDELQQVLELLLPPLSPDKMEIIKQLLNSMIKRRFGSWGGRKRSEFYSWGGRRKRDQTDNNLFQPEEVLPKYSGEMKLMDDIGRGSDVDKVGISDKDNSGETLLTTVKRHDFYPWGGKRTLPPTSIRSE